jgi:hypothetical protein
MDPPASDSERGVPQIQILKSKIPNLRGTKVGSLFKVTMRKKACFSPAWPIFPFAFV